MPAVEAARSVALREIARVTNDPKLTGALTDSARSEVSGLSPTNATFAQIKKVATILQQDMANVHRGLSAAESGYWRKTGDSGSAAKAGEHPELRGLEESAAAVNARHFS